jgi:hypothetical protein
MTISRGYTANPKFYDRMGRITPNTHKPHGEWIPAPWLPVQRYDTSEFAWKVISEGKVVALAGDGNLVPAGLKKAFNVATSSNAITYTADDVTDGTIDLTTGVAVTAAGSYTETQLTAALRERGLITGSQRATDFISKPVGVANYDYYAAPGTDHYNPRTLKYTNYRPQALTSILCDYVITVPVLPALATTEAVTDLTGEAAGYLEDLFDGTNARSTAYTGFFTSAQIAQVTRYSGQVSSGDDVVVFMTENAPIAHITEDSPITTSTDSCLVRQVDSISAISGAGDFFVDYEVGAIFLYEAGGNAIPSPWVAGTTTISYYHYGSAVSSGTRVSSYVCATGNLEYGDFLTYDVNSNFIKATLDISAAEGYSDSSTGALYSVDPEYDTQATNSVVSIQLEKAIMGYNEGIIGQVIGTTIYGSGQYENDYLGSVKTAFEGQTAANMQTPGSATGGRTDQLTYANGAERMLVINLIMR